MRINNMLPFGGIGDTLAGNVQGECIHTVFEAIARSYPEIEAVAHHEQSISYQTLNEKANYLASCLINKGIRPGELVGVKLDKGIDQLVAMLGIMKAGAAYLPLDPAYPLARINYMLEDSNTRHLISSAASAGLHEGIHQHTISDFDGQLEENICTAQDAHSLAYLIYTSGTTGKPKGVMVGHAGFVNMCLHQIAVYKLGLNERVLQFASISFDASVYEIFIALLSGATLVIVDKETSLDKKLFLDYINRQKLTFILLPPVFLNSLDRPDFPTVKTIVTAGEACNVADALHYSTTKKYFNAYGPTEASVCVSLQQVKPDHAYGNYIPIGKAIPNITFYILDENLKPVGKGEAGELYIGGIGLAQGYINKPELTQKAFVELPGKPGERVYRSGDIVQQTADGSLIILGRKDKQVKILGHRIELGAIEHAMLSAAPLQAAPISNAHVSAVEHAGEKHLCAWFTAPAAIEVAELRERLLEELPHFMVPNWFMQVPAFTMTINGKIDQGALPMPAWSRAENTNPDKTPQGPEELLLAICKEVLGVNQLSLADNFFLLGGHSLKAARLSAKISKAFQVELAVSQIYQKPHIHEILAGIQNGRRHLYETIMPAPAKRYYNTSAAQKRMFVMSSTDKVDVSYNVSIVLHFEKRIGKTEVARVLKKLSDRHEVLRTRFDIQFDELVQEVLPAAEISLQDGGLIAAEELPALAKSFVRPFDLGSAPILRAGYYEMAGGACAIILDTHHIIADGTSMGILVNEFLQLLHHQPLPALALQYKDYAEWEHLEHARGGYFEAHEQYWLNTFRDIPVLKMPTDRMQPEGEHVSGERLSFTIDKAVALKLKQFALEMDVSVYQLLLSVYYLLLSKYTNQHEIVVGTAVANRKKEEVQQMMGMFVNTLALRAEVPAEMTFSHFVHAVKKMVLEAFDYQEYPFELLVSRLGLSGNAAKVPLIDTLFVVQNIDFFNEEAVQGLSLKYENATATSKFDFSFFIVEQAEAFVLEVEYNTGIFSREYICSLAEDFITLAGKAVESPEAQLEEISLVDHKMLPDMGSLLNTSNAIGDLEFDI